MMEESRGDFIDGAFKRPKDGVTITSHDPARDFQPVFRATASVAHVDVAIEAARRAQPAWAALSVESRHKHMMALKVAFDEAADKMARMIVREMGKPFREALAEAKSLGERIPLIFDDGMKRIATLKPDGVAGEARAHPQGVLAVVGPYNYPAHLVNAHVIPALATGNTVVVKPSEITPGVGELYATCVERAGLPPGVFNLVQGGGDVGRVLSAHPLIDGVLFTGSWRTGRAIMEANLDQPHKLIALEMGGKNVAVVCDDADLQQALAAVLQGAFLSAGQRCTATSRLMVFERVADRFIDALVAAARELRPGDPMEPSTTFGPLATKDALERFVRIRNSAATAGCEQILLGSQLPGGAFVTPSIHMLPDGVKEAKGYLDEELFGPDLCVEIVSGIDDAIARTNAMPFGLSNAIFTVDAAKFERFYQQTRSGCVNWNRSTNNASGKLPFGGVGKSGNQRPAGVDAVRYTTFPVAVLKGEIGDTPVEPAFTQAFRAGDERLKMAFDRLTLRHRVERMLESYRIYLDDVRGPDVLVPLEQLTDLTLSDNLLEPSDVVQRLSPYATLEDAHVVITVPDVEEGDVDAQRMLDVVRAFLDDLARENPMPLLRLLPKAIRRPPGGKLPRSEAMLRRLYRGEFVPKEKKEPVIDLGWSEGPYLASIDDDALVILDAGSQIASVGMGFAPGRFLSALDNGELGEALVANPDTETVGAERAALEEYSRFLLKQSWAGIRHVSFTSSGAEANEKAFDLCRLHGPGGKRIICFDGSFHGRTLMALHATHNPEKRKPFEMKGYEAAYVPFPKWSDPREEPPVSDAWITAWSTGQTPGDEGDALVQTEIEALVAVRNEIKKGDVCCVIVEPMQGEGGDNYATARFFNGLRALTRGFSVPLVFDEVQCGFGLGGPFWWHSLFNLKNTRGQMDGPDCITTAKKAQVGVCLSAWNDPRPAPAHVVQVQRGLLHGLAVSEYPANDISNEVQEQLWTLAVDYPALVKNPRNIGWCFAFDLPSSHLANQVINQRFYRGFMAYIAGEKTVRFRLNAAWSIRDVEMLFQGLREALNAIAARARGVEPAKQKEAMEAYKAPAWEDGSGRNAEPARTSGGSFGLNYDTLSEDPPQLLAWMTHLPRGPLEKVCDRVLGMEGQFDDTIVEESLKRLTEQERAWAYPSKIVERLRHVSDEIARADDPQAAYDVHTERLGMEPVRLLAEVLGARVVVLDPSEWGDYADKIVDIENSTYEEGRRDSEDELRRMVTTEGGVGVLLVRYTDIGERILGYAFGGPVEHYKSDGPREDPMNGRNNTFYSANITVAPGARGTGLGRRLKSAQVQRVAEIPRPSTGPASEGTGAFRYEFMSGRNRLGFTRDMAAINRIFGAYVVEHYKSNQYGDKSGQALYYRIPLRRPRCPTALPPPAVHAAQSEVIDWASAVQSPLGARHPRLAQALLDGEMTGAVGTKLTLSNWVTPSIVRYAETLMHLGPKGLPHVFFTSGRDEMIDKCIRMLRVKRKEADVVIGLERQYVGHTTAAARSLSDPAGEQQPFAWFDWPRVPHPAEVGTDAAIGAIMATMNRVGPNRVLGIFVELVGERSGLVLPPEFQAELSRIHQDTGVPIVAIETASSLGRTGSGMWECDGAPLKPNVVLWFAGGQLGHIFVDDKNYIAKPLTLISTWDGDELSMVRAHHHLLEARSLLKHNHAAAFERAIEERALPGKRVGAGLWQVIDVGDEHRADAVRKAAWRRGLRLGRGLPGRLVVCPSLAVTPDEADAGLARLAQALREA